MPFQTLVVLVEVHLLILATVHLLCVVRRRLDALAREPVAQLVELLHRHHVGREENDGAAVDPGDVFDHF